MPYVITDECIQCGACESNCENQAIKEGPDHQVIDPALCNDCGTCVESCPVEAIKKQE